MELVWFILAGLTVGLVASQIGRGGSYGIWGDVVLGVLGAVLGGYLYGTFGGALGGGLVGSIGVATLGAVLLVFVARRVSRRGST